MQVFLILLLFMIIITKNNDINDIKGSMQLPTFQEEPACAKCCPKLTFKQRIIGKLSIIILYIYIFILLIIINN